MSGQLSRGTWGTAYGPFKPSKSGQRSPPPFYRGCWHGVSRGFLAGYRQPTPKGWLLPPPTGVYTPKGFFPHAASLGHPFGHCPRSSAAAPRRGPGRVSVPVRPATLSGRLPVIGLVGRYPTNYLMGRAPIPERHPPFRNGHLSSPAMRRGSVSGISPSFPGLSQSPG